MSFQIKYQVLIPLLFLSFCLGSCDNPTPTSQNLPYNPGCSTSNLIAHIGFANSLPGPDVINLDPDCVYILADVEDSALVGGVTVHNGLPRITSDLLINGNNAVIEIQSTHLGPFFIEPDGDLEIYNLTLKNGARPVGGAVINIGGDFFASYTRFLNNTAFPADADSVARGGAIYNDSGRVRVIDNSHFQDNNAGETMTTGANLGGAIYSKNGTLVVSSSSFINNFAAGDGGAIYTQKNTSDESGGLITINNSTFYDNIAYRNGGAISLIDEIEGSFVISSFFRENQADNYGGAIFARGSDLEGTTNVFRYNNSAFGGAVYTKRLGEGGISTYISRFSEFWNNTASEIGGAIFSENSDLSLDESFFDSNTGSSCGAIRTGGSPTLDVEAGDLETAQRIYSLSRITDSEFKGNEALLTHGGAVCHVMGDISVEGTMFFANTAADSGGGMIIHDKTDISGVNFLANDARIGGGLLIGYPLQESTPGTYTWVSPDYLTFHTTISNSTFGVNQASQAGGGIYAHHLGSVVILKSSFHNNAADFAGGGIRLEEGDMQIQNSTFSGNISSKGGGIFARGEIISQPKLDIIHSTFAYNVATETSGGEYNHRWGGGAINAGGYVHITYSLITQNTSIDCQLANNTTYSNNNYLMTETVDSDGQCAAPMTELNPKIGPFTNNGGSTSTHALLSDSPLIDLLSNCALPDDQRGVLRYQGTACEPGAYEYDPSDPPLPPPLPPSLPGTPPEDSFDCDPFAGMEVSLLTLGLPGETMTLPVVLRADYEIPGLNPEAMNGSPLYEYRAQLGDNESLKCGLQGFPDRLYCLFKIPSNVPGMALDFKLYLNECEDPVYLQPLLSIPEPKAGDDPGDPGLVCTMDLKDPECSAAGGKMSEGTATVPICVCP